MHAGPWLSSPACAGGLFDTKHLCKLQPRLVPVNSLGQAFQRVHSPEFSRDVSTALQVSSSCPCHPRSRLDVSAWELPLAV